MRFRADIEGLRGVAVAMVVLAHAGVPGVQGGFSGVDVFFVISGFLITSILSRELATGNAIDFWGFYARRAKRLMPALLLMLVVVGILSAIVMPPSALPLQARTGMLAAAWVSNFHFAFERLDYFAADASSSLYLHTWSLGVEEQFYLVWPLMLVIAWKWRPTQGHARLVGEVALVAVIGFLVAVLAHAHDAVAAYYLMPTRLWELALGGLAALLARPKAATGLKRAEWLRGTGLGLITLGVLAIRQGQGFLFAWLLLPTVGSALVLFAQGAESGPVFRLLACRPLRFLGRVSYAFYLWHWPALGLARASFGDRPVPVALAVLLALACAWLSTVWLEDPVRRLQWAKRKAHVVLGLVTSLALVVGHLAWSEAIQRDLTARRAPWRALLRQQFSGPVLYRLGCDRTFKSAELYPCVIVDTPQPTQRVLLLGDSVAAQWTPALEGIAQRRGWRLVTLTKAGCPIADVRIHYARIGREYFECAQWRDRVAGYLKRTRFDVVIISSASRYTLTPAQWVSGTRSFLARTEGSTPEIVMLDPTPALPFNPLDCLLSLDGRSDEQLDRCAVPLASARSPAVLSALRQASAPFPHVRHVSLDALVCPRHRCAVMRDGQLVYRDAVHLNVQFARQLAAPLEATLRPSASTAGHADPSVPTTQPARVKKQPRVGE